MMLLFMLVNSMLIFYVDVDGNLDLVDDDDERLAHLVDVAHVQLAVNSQWSWLVGLWSLVVLRKK